ncbi:glycosyl transferase family 2 [Sporomusaceae bacterium FL31]|nr:glycosyl transferase family 2 [Sporomusaceae bacterium FL31]GCE33899.1 glycosyl transferase family 2 [Sporomusaceae bacterium]
MNTVTVIIPTWNRDKTIKEAIYSALNQTHPPLEVLVCDDGSSDNSEAIVKGIKDKRVRWIQGNRGGRPAIPRNRGILESHGDWLAFLDSDDKWLPDKLEKQIKKINLSNYKASCTNAHQLIPEKGIVGNLLKMSNEFITFDDLIKDNQVICSSVLIHRSLFTDVIGFPESEQLRALEDYSLWLRVAALTNFSYIEEPLLLYRDDAGNSIRGEETVDIMIQKKRVISDFLAWSKHNEKIHIYRNKIKRYYAKLMLKHIRNRFIQFLCR